MARRWVCVGFFILFVACICNSPVVRGQAVYGSIAGTVNDVQGAAVVGGKVTVTNAAKGTTEETTTNENGNFTVTHLIPDAYKVRIEAPGFKSYDVPNVVVGVDVVVRVDAQLQVGDVTQSVEVSGEIPQLQTEKSDVSTTFGSQTVEALPIYNRNFTTFQLLSPGNQRLNGWNHAASENPQGSQQILTQGQHFAGTAFELDGTDNQDPILGIIVINPNLDAIEEVKITAQDYDAEFGKAIGAVVTSQTKSGTNAIHGSAFDYERSNANFARNPFTEPKTVAKGNWNQFGGEIGAPIIKNKLFVFGDYQGLRSHVGASATDRVPTAAERGNIATGIGANLSDIGKTIYDPYVAADAGHTTLLLGANGQPIPLSASQRSQSSPSCPPGGFCGAFPGNIIPASRLSPQAVALLAQIPLPNLGVTNALSNNFTGSGSNVLDSDGFDVRSDFAATSKMHIFGRYSYQKFLRAGPGLFGTLIGGPALPADPSVGSFAGNSNVHDHSVAAGFDYTLSPTLLTDVRFGFFKYNVGTAPGGVGTTPAAAAGIPGLNLSDKFYTSGMPAFQIHVPGEQDQFGFGYSLGVNQCNCPLTEDEHQYQFVNNWTKIHGNHTFKFGGDVRYAYNLRVPSDSHRAGQLDFNNDITQGPGGDGGAGLAGFLLGYVSHFTRYVSNSTNAYETQPRLFFYGQDTWRFSNKLTFNLGLRWEIYKPESVPRTGGGGWVDLATGEIRVAGQNGVDSTGNTSTSYTHLAPRLGIAYQVNSKTVVRLGYGRSYDIGVFGSIFGHTVTQNLPVLGSQDYSGGGAGAQDFNTAFFLSNGPVSFDPTTKLTVNNCNAITDPSGVNPVTGVFTADKTECVGPQGRPLLPNGVFSRARPFNNRLPTVDAWNASVQRQITPTLTATVAYVGNKGTHTLVGDNPAYSLNGATDAGYFPGCQLATNSATVPNPATCPNGALPPQLRTPLYTKYGWTQGIDYFGNDANNNYNSLQITTEKRFSNGLSFQSSYTFQHANYYLHDFNGGDGYYNINHKISYGPNNSYRNHVFILTQVYQLPFGRGKRFMGDMGRAGDLLLGGWAVNSSWNFSSGLPFTPQISSCTPEIDNGPCMPNRAGAVRGGPRSGDPRASGYWFQTTGGVALTGTVCTVTGTPAPVTAGPWGQPGCQQFGNVGVNSFRGPLFFNTDAAVFKDFAFTERLKMQFQFQAFNVFNHVNLDLPNRTVDSSSGGSINAIAFGSQMRRLQFGLKLNF
jgi:outer membrane receptor protein involved in Fe transport